MYNFYIIDHLQMKIFFFTNQKANNFLNKQMCLKIFYFKFKFLSFDFLTLLLK